MIKTFITVISFSFLFIVYYAFLIPVYLGLAPFSNKGTTVVYGSYVTKNADALFDRVTDADLHFRWLKLPDLEIVSIEKISANQDHIKLNYFVKDRAGSRKMIPATVWIGKRSLWKSIVIELKSPNESFQYSYVFIAELRPVNGITRIQYSLSKKTKVWGRIFFRSEVIKMRETLLLTHQELEKISGPSWETISE